MQGRPPLQRMTGCCAEGVVAGPEGVTSLKDAWSRGGAPGELAGRVPRRVYPTRVPKVGGLPITDLCCDQVDLQGQAPEDR